MNKSDKEKHFLNFLRENQPMPSDDLLTEELIKTYDEARLFFHENPNKECIPLFLNSFGYIDGFGVYQLIEHVIAQYAMEDVLDDLKKSLSSEYPSVRYWSAHVASRFPSEKLLPSLSKLLQEDDIDIKTFGLIAIGQIKSPEINDIINEFLRNEIDQELIAMAMDIQSRAV